MSRKRRLSPTDDRDRQLRAQSRSNSGADDQKIRNDGAPDIGDATVGGGSSHYQYQLLACGCNMHGQLAHDRDRDIVPDASWLSDDTDGSASKLATLASAAREPSLFATVDTPTVIVTAGESMRLLYVGVNTICVERDGQLYLRGLLPTLTPLNHGRHRELPIALPSNIRTSNIKLAFGTRWAFIGVILNDGGVLAFSLAAWSLTELPNIYEPRALVDIQINRLGESCFLYSEPPGHKETGIGSIIKIYPPVKSISEGLYNSTLESFSAGDVDPVSVFRLPIGECGADPGERFTKVTATSTGFIALTSAGNVYTYGDGRFNSLGRPPSATVSPDTPGGLSNGCGWGQVTALDGVFITQIAANPGGHVQLALAQDGTGYIWGGDGTENINVPVHADAQEVEDEDVQMIDILDARTGEPLEFENMAVGEDHAVMIETGGRGVWVSGGSDMGQTGFGVEFRCLPTALGIDEEAKRERSIWRRWDDRILRDCGSNTQVVQAACGFGCTLMVVRHLRAQ
ncbi:hypothetical protein H072_10548 [Dactylellina haptotyla CBS 200.50]|uniref:Uncharacterized protein n=1 Tax=Dactylellina haptotyla (strain CBS 200.50) TaxID=1284197 RepID=S7ZZV5_DACHA|nr:hypothetical protein H072_10548 [Dactylellina haptotyla CBS 200.50]